MSEVRDILMRTKRLLTSGHWSQHAMRVKRHNENDEVIETYCLVGGLRMTSGYYGDGYGFDQTQYEKACRAVAEVLLRRETSSLRQPVVEHTIISFNDAIGRSVDEIVSVIDRAAERVSS